MAWQLAHRGTRSVSGSTSLVLREGLDVVDLDVAARVLDTVDLVEVELAHLADRSVDLYGPCAVLPASLVGDVLDDPLASFAIGNLLFVYGPMGHVVYLQGVFGNSLAPVEREQQL